MVFDALLLAILVDSVVPAGNKQVLRLPIQRGQSLATLVALICFGLGFLFRRLGGFLHQGFPNVGDNSWPVLLRPLFIRLRLAVRDIASPFSLSLFPVACRWPFTHMVFRDKTLLIYLFPI